MKSLFTLIFVMLVAYAHPAFADNAQLLASQCFQCHGPNGRSKGEIDSIAGKSAADLYGDLLEMKRKQKIEIMHLQAKIYTDQELLQIANYLSTKR
ncbi:MAG: cytochrome c class I [Methylobacter sp.]|nr:MAG: cytochrome c class I [Methylobacter sp.]PPD20914.1 MAG: cytochrome c class I [Methylobacter sp.]PPD36508.1 MAG: cytochrome c class I [Methylomonas sp.]